MLKIRYSNQSSIDRKPESDISLLSYFLLAVGRQHLASSVLKFAISNSKDIVFSALYVLYSLSSPMVWRVASAWALILLIFSHKFAASAVATVTSIAASRKAR